MKNEPAGQKRAKNNKQGKLACCSETTGSPLLGSVALKAA